jgi:ferric-dicitrate binding protein FerR (iron transport regulator)
MPEPSNPAEYPAPGSEAGPARPWPFPRAGATVSPGLGLATATSAPASTDAPARPALAPGPAVSASLPGYPALTPTFSPFTADPQAALRLAWRVMLAAFATFMALLIGIPLARSWYVNSAIEPQSSAMRPIDGVVYIRRNGLGDWVAARPSETLAVGDVLRTAANARAFITLFDQSTVLLYPNSTMRILRAEQGRFRPERRSIVLELSDGWARIGVSPPPDPQSAFFQVRTPTAAVHLAEGSYSINTENQQTQVSTRLGEATAYTSGGSAAARSGQRLVIQPGQAPQGALPARRDLLANGLFTARVSSDRNGLLPAGWQARDTSELNPPGVISLTTIPGAVSFQRTGRGHGETVLAQTLDADLWDYEKVTLSATVRVLSHSLGGGGWRGSEYPLMLRVIYRDANGGINPWYHGFYLQNEDGNPVPDGEQLPSTDWYHFELNLLSLTPRPLRIQRVEVAALGWDYSSAISEIHIWAE